MSEDASDAYDKTHEMDRDVLPTGELPVLERLESGTKPRIRPVRFGIKAALFVLVFYFFLGLLPNFRDAANRIRDVNPILLVVGFALQLVALYAYSLLTRAALGEAATPLSSMRMFRIQLSTKALTNVVPGGNAAGSALGYRLLTLSGIQRPGCRIRPGDRRHRLGGRAQPRVLARADRLGASTRCQPCLRHRRAHRDHRHRHRRLPRDRRSWKGRAGPNGWSAGSPVRSVSTTTSSPRSLHQIGERLEELISDRKLLKRVVVFALLNWLIDAASLWVFLRAFGGSLDVDALIVAFGLANLLAAVPITPGGLGYVDLLYVATLVGFGLGNDVARLGVATYRFAQFFFPIFIGAVAYLSLRVGPWKIERRDRLVRLRELARSESSKGESNIDFALRFGRRAGDATGSARRRPQHDRPRRTRSDDEPTS